MVRSVSRICACTVTSSAVVGSSAMISSGWFAIAIAMTTRCRIPPDSSCGYLRAIWAGSGRPTRSSSSTARFQVPRRSARPCSRRHSATCQPTVYIGFSAVSGSWNTIATRAPRIARHSAGPQSSSSFPSSLIDPLTRADSGSSPRMARASMVLPDPDSPTTPIVSRALSETLTPRTASMTPASVGRLIRRSSTSSSGPGREDGAVRAAPSCLPVIT